MDLLFVEDEPVLRLTCVDAAESSGHSVRAAANALEGLRMLREHVPDAIVTDLMMPGMDGCEFIAIVHRIAPNVPIIVLTALASEDSRHNALNAGATRYLVKPVSAVDLVALLEEYGDRNGNSVATPTP